MKNLKRLRRSLIAFCVVFSGCGKMPPITSCIYSVDYQTFFCVDPEGKEFQLVADDAKADKFICIPHTDFNVLLDWCGGDHNK